jgi:hypothetical protein
MSLLCLLCFLRLLVVRSGRRSSEIDLHRLCEDEQRLELDRALDLE